MTLHNSEQFFQKVEVLCNEGLKAQVAKLHNETTIPVVVPVEEAFVNLNGIVVPDLERAKREARYKKGQIIANRKAAYLAAIDYKAKFENDRAKLRRKLNEVGVNPIVIVPESAWTAIRHKYGLYQFTFDKKGRVGANPPDVKQLMGKMWFGAQDPQMVLKKYLSTNSHKSLLQDLFPNLISVDHSNLRVSLRFPDPPEVVSAKLKELAAAKISFQITAEPDAITFVPGLDEQLLDHFKSVVEHERMLTQAEPIVQVNHGVAVAIIDQYGPFALEIAGVAEALSDCNLCEPGITNHSLEVREKVGDQIEEERRRRNSRQEFI